MKFSVSNIALTEFDHTEEIDQLASLGFSGLEVAPSRAWRDTWKGLTSSEVKNYRKSVEAAGLSVVGLHSLLFDQPELALFSERETRENTLSYLTHLSKICRDLGGKTLIWGAGRKHSGLNFDLAEERALEFIRDLLSRVQDHGTCFCFEPLGPGDTNFVNSVLEAIELVKIIDHSAFQIQIDSKALMENDEVNASVFQKASPYLVHYHANEPGFGSLDGAGRVEHGKMAEFLCSVNYTGYVSLEQRMLDEMNPIAGLEKSVQILKECYG